jgi:CRP-like cAMP-binding protein
MNHKVDPTHWGVKYSLMTFKSQEYLFREGQTPQGIYFLRSGAIRVTSIRSNKPSRTSSMEHLVKLVSPNEFFGFKAIFKGVDYYYSARAAANCEVIFIKKEDLFSSFNVSNQVLGTLLLQSIRDTETMERHHELEYMTSVSQRIAFHLIRLSERFGVKTAEGILLNVKLSRKELAEIAGTIDESLSRHLSNFKDQDLIVLRSKEIILRNPEALKALLPLELQTIKIAKEPDYQFPVGANLQSGFVQALAMK